MDFLLRTSHWLRAVFLPQECVLCRRLVCNPDWSPLCTACRLELPRLTEPCCRTCGLPLSLIERSLMHCRSCRRSDPGFDRACAAGPYRGRLRCLLHEYKFRGHQRLAAPLAELAAAAFRSRLLDEGWDCLVPIPSHPRRVRRRGFDSVAALCRELTGRLQLEGLPMLRRIRATPPQVGLSAAERERNLAGAFRLIGSTGGVRAVLVDDVLTSGATARSAASALRLGGASRIGVLTVARALAGSSWDGYSVSETIASSTHGSGAGSSGTWPE